MRDEHCPLPIAGSPRRRAAASFKYCRQNLPATSPCSRVRNRQPNGRTPFRRGSMAAFARAVVALERRTNGEQDDQVRRGSGTGTRHDSGEPRAGPLLRGPVVRWTRQAVMRRTRLWRERAGAHVRSSRLQVTGSVFEAAGACPAASISARHASRESVTRTSPRGSPGETSNEHLG